MTFLLLKWVHILSATILLGTGLGSAFYLFVANRTRDVGIMYFACKYVVIADWLFTAPAVIIQLLTGIGLMHMAGYGFSDIWIAWSLALYAFAAICWLPVVWMQIEMRNMTATALVEGTDVPLRYWRFDRWWVLLGSFAFPAVLLIFALMVFKP